MSTHSPDIRVCWRCGIDFKGHGRYIAGTPCRDCREFLRNDGDTTIWSSRTLAKQVAA